MLFLNGIKVSLARKIRRVKLAIKMAAGNKRVVSEVCKGCGTRNYEQIPVNVVMGSFSGCEKCGQFLFFPSPGSPFKEGQKRKEFEDLVISHIK